VWTTEHCTHTIADPAANGGLRGVAYGNHLLFVANGNAIYVFDPSQGYALVRTITDPNFNGAVALAFGGNTLYAADSAYNQVTVFDAANGYAFVRNITWVMFPAALAAQ
jgi:DNA-binding beta-propeller fold protein YncE